MCSIVAIELSSEPSGPVGSVEGLVAVLDRFEVPYGFPPGGERGRFHLHCRAFLLKDVGHVPFHLLLSRYNNIVPPTVLLYSLVLHTVTL